MINCIILIMTRLNRLVGDLFNEDRGTRRTRRLEAHQKPTHRRDNCLQTKQLTKEDGPVNTQSSSS